MMPLDKERAPDLALKPKAPKSTSRLRVSGLTGCGAEVLLFHFQQMLNLTEAAVTIPGRKETMIVRRVNRRFAVDARNPASVWQSAEPVTFSTDWQGNNPDPALETKVQALWFGAPGKAMGRAQVRGEDQLAALYLRFECRYRELFVFEDCETNGRRDHLWERDVAEAFFQPEFEPRLASHNRPGERNSYAEFEVAPNGMWIDLDIFPSGRRDLNSGLTRSVHVETEPKIWTAELAIPLSAITAQFDPNIPWRGNFYRVEGTCEPRSYLAWQPTGTPEPNFHVPRAFGTLRFEL